MVDQPKSDRTSVTISKRVQREFKAECALEGVTQREIIEVLVRTWMASPRFYRLLEFKEEE